MLPPDLLEILVCPACKKPLTEEVQGLLCAQCHRIYPIRDGIPVLLVDQAVVSSS